MSQIIFEDFDKLIHALCSGDKEKAWKHFISIKTDLDFDDNATPMELKILRALNTHLSHAIFEKSAARLDPQLSMLRASVEDRIKASN